VTRPAGTTTGQLGFTPQQATRWLNPRQLFRTAVAVLLADIFGAYADKRELQQCGVFTQAVFGHGGDELWLDYVSDLGDGFDATYSVASLVAQDELTVDGATPALPRGDVLVLGGDEVYPVADAFAYEARTTRVYAAALPETPGPRPVLYALPGNHDWYDGLTAFLRVFAQGEAIGGWDTAQRRSYFGLRLPRRWWLLAVDIQLDTYIDGPQLAYFRGVAGEIRPGDGVILCTAKPSWYPRAHGDGNSLARLEYFARKVLAGTGAHLRLVLTGDSHHYARYTAEGSGQTLLTSGLGGAYTSATHHLDESLTLSPRLDRPGDRGTEPVTYRLAPKTWPPRERSRRMALDVVVLPFRNRGFWALLGAVQAVFMTALLTSGLLWTASVALVMVLAAVGFAAPTRGGILPRLRLGVPHGLAHPLLGGAAGAACAAAGPGWPVGIAVAVATPVVGLLSAEVVAAYLWFASRRRAHVNELFAAQSREDYKGFVRMHIGPEGVRVYPIGLRRVADRWSARPDGAPGDPWLEPAEPLRPELIEEPFLVTREPAPPPP
jgi:hypothetical protein